VTQSNFLMRGLMAIISGLLIVTCLVAYGGIGINIIFFAADRGISLGNMSYRVLGIYSLAMTLVLTSLAFLLIAEFNKWKLRQSRSLFYVVVTSIFLLISAHFLAYLNMTRVADVEIREWFIDGAIYYPLAVFAALMLFTVVRWLACK